MKKVQQRRMILSCIEVYTEIMLLIIHIGVSYEPIPNVNGNWFPER